MNKLDNLKLIEKLDCSNMLEFIQGLPEQCREAYRIGISINVNQFLRSKALSLHKIDTEPRLQSGRMYKPVVKIDNIVFAGVGGSGIGADLVKVYLRDELKTPVSICRDYTLPDFVGEGTLLFCSSYSGNTEETLSCFEQGLKRKSFIITIGSGGSLKEMSLKSNFTHITIPPGYPPRAAIGYMSITALGVLAKLGLIKDKENDVKELYYILSDIRDKEIGPDVPAPENISKQIAEKLCGRCCIIYGTADTTEAVSVRWREQIAENAKALSFSNVLPEMNHNEIVGWRFPEKPLKDFMAIMLSDKDDHERTKERARISKEIIRKSGAEVMVLKREKGARLARVYALMYIGDFASFYLAILNNIDPTPVDDVDYLKRELGKI